MSLEESAPQNTHLHTLLFNCILHSTQFLQKWIKKNLLCFTFTHTQSEKLNAKRKILATVLLQPAGWGGGGGGGTDTGFKRPIHNNNSFFNPSYAGNTWGLLFWIFGYNNEYPTKYCPFHPFTMLLHHVSKSLHRRTWVQISLGTKHSPTFHNNKGPSYSWSTLLAGIKFFYKKVLLGIILYYFILYYFSH